MNPTPLLLLPGLVCDARLWKHQVSGLSSIAHTTVASFTESESIADFAAAAISQMKSETFAVAGLSMGGYVAFEILRQAPERVSSLALLDTSARPDSPETTGNRRKMMKLAEKDFPAVIDAMLPKLLHPDHLQYATLVSIVKNMAADCGKDVFIRQQNAIIGRPDSRPFLKNISCPTLVLCGQNDQITPPEVHEEMAAGIPNSELVVIPECGHLSPLEQPDQTTQALKIWLSRAG